ncbi:MULTISPECIES: ABC transporter permease [Eubacteriales]|uniref:ABC transporter permease n=1 Tax=Eubacteriales TaxID=186802 RepID=UPI0013025AD9|nr:MULTISPECIES: ABC transporter permease [Eubacteriales]
MSILENVRLALTSLRANKLRALLTMLGIIIGISAVIAIITVGDSLSGSLAEEMSGFGARNVTLSVVQKDDPFAFGSFNTLEDSEELDKALESFEYKEPSASDRISDAMLQEYQKKFSDQLQALAVSESFGNISVVSGRHKASGQLMGVSPGQQTLDKITLLAGRFVTDADSTNHRAVAVVSDRFVAQYFGNKTTPENALGKSFKTDASGIPLRLYIIGVYEYKPPAGQTVTRNLDTNIYIPVGSGFQLLQRDSGYQTVTLQSREDVNNQIFMDRTREFFNSFYSHNSNFSVSVSSLDDIVKSMNKMTQSVKLGISAIAAISLLVGGIGVMNIMMVSVTERTREIGIRMALGAKSRVILFQFIVEAIIICLIGGMIGVILGVGLGSAGAMMMHYPVKPSLTAALVAVLFSMAIGVFFGYYPAKRAARLDPIEALRYE